MYLSNLEQSIIWRKRFRHRLIGAVILTVLSTLILPIFFDSPYYSANIAPIREGTSFLVSNSTSLPVFPFKKTVGSNWLSEGYFSLPLGSSDASIQEDSKLYSISDEASSSDFLEQEEYWPLQEKPILIQEKILQKELGENLTLLPDKKEVIIDQEIADWDEYQSSWKSQHLSSLLNTALFLVIIEQFQGENITSSDLLRFLEKKGFHLSWTQELHEEGQIRLIVALGPYELFNEAENELAQLVIGGFSGRVFQK